MPDGMQLWTAAMRIGDFAGAWALSDAAMRMRDPSGRDDPNLPFHQRWVWDGRPFDGRDVLVRCYHGLGDTIQFARFLPLLARRAASVTVEMQPHLLPLMAELHDGIRFVPFDPAAPAPPSSCDIEITELPHALRAAPADAPWPYLSVPPAILPADAIGLCYAAGEWDQERCVPPDLLAPLCGARACLTLVAEPTDLPVLNPEGCPRDIMVTAALVAGARAVITVDTMIAHLAGALGRPTWLMLKAEPDWRWSPADRTSPWYPSMRLFCQPAPGDWPAVVAAIARDLSTLPPAAEGASDNGQHGEPHRSGVLG